MNCFIGEGDDADAEAVDVFEFDDIYDVFNDDDIFDVDDDAEFSCTIL